MEDFLEYRVSDAMTARPLAIDPETSLGTLERLFEEHDFDCLPVVDADGVLLGVVTKLDFLRAFAFGHRTMIPRYGEIMRQRAASIMTRKPVTVPPDMNLTRVLQMMVDTRHKSFPVTRGAHLIGIVSREDVIDALRQAAGDREARQEGPCTTIVPSSVR